MLVYGSIQLGGRIISALALVTIALSLCSIKQEAEFFNQCIREAKASGQTASSAVRYCNGATN